MTNKNAEYDFKWCPGCGDFGVRRALEFATLERNKRLDLSMESNVVVAGIGCSGNLVHLLEGSQPYGFHGIHGRSLPLSMGVKMARPELNVIVVAGDGDFLSIGAEHIAPQAARNLNCCAVIMDNGVYGLTKGQSSPTTEIGEITSSTPFGKPEDSLDPFELYMAVGVSFIASSMSSQVRELSKLIGQAMDHPGFSIVHVQSPCTTYNDTYEQLKGNVKEGYRAPSVRAARKPRFRRQGISVQGHTEPRRAPRRNLPRGSPHTEPAYAGYPRQSHPQDTGPATRRLRPVEKRQYRASNNADGLPEAVEHLRWLVAMDNGPSNGAILLIASFPWAWAFRPPGDWASQQRGVVRLSASYTSHPHTWPPLGHREFPPRQHGVLGGPV